MEPPHLEVSQVAGLWASRQLAALCCPRWISALIPKRFLKNPFPCKQVGDSEAPMLLLPSFLHPNRNDSVGRFAPSSWVKHFFPVAGYNVYSLSVPNAQLSQESEPTVLFQAPRTGNVFYEQLQFHLLYLEFIWELSRPWSHPTPASLQEICFLLLTNTLKLPKFCCARYPLKQ